MPTYRIIVQSSNPLDGVTRLPADGRDRMVVDPESGIYTLTLEASEDFGAFSPGDLGLLSDSASYDCHEVTVQSFVGGTVAHAAGSVVSLVSPPTLAANVAALTVIELDGGDPAGLGVWPEGLSVPMPPQHLLSFDTQADGLAAGPHVIQFSIEPGALFEREAAVAPE